MSKEAVVSTSACICEAIVSAKVVVSTKACVSVKGDRINEGGRVDMEFVATQAIA